MKVILLLANGNYSILPSVKEVITRVLTELEVEVDVIDLNKLGYFTSNKAPEMDKVIGCIKESQAVIAISSVALIGMHAAMQNFFDHMSVYPGVIKGKPLFTITYSEWLGELDAAHLITKGWSILGGSVFSSMCLNKRIVLGELTRPLEKNIENLYRVIKQDISPIVCNESYIYRDYEINKPEEVEVLEDLVGKTFDLAPNDTDEITRLLKEQINTPYKDAFVEMGAGIYTRPAQGATPARIKKIQALPHYFIAKHDKSLDMIIQYILTDTHERGYLTIKNGDCEYTEGIAEAPTIEISLTEEILQALMSQKVTYQKAFMVGKLKVKGNFILVAKLDQIFKAI